MKQKLFEKSWIWLLLIALIAISLLYRTLFLGEIIRASDIASQYIWGVMGGYSYPGPFSGIWAPNVNFGTDITIGSATGMMPMRLMVYGLFPFPVNIGWEIVTHIIFAGIGAFLYCRALGLSRFSSFLASLFFILSSEIITLINAGHVGKINTIVWTPWIFLTLEKGLQERRPYYFFLTGGALAFQFIEQHWQIAFYTCLAVGFYFIFRLISIYLEDRDVKEGGKLTIYAILMVIIFFAASSISFLPVYEWSKTTERAGGMAVDEGMTWSMPPEELVTYVIPGFFGLSRRESGPDPGYIDIYYWGRMIFTQTTDYMGILPLVLAVSALLYRRNWHVRFFLFLSAFTMIVALGKYTPIYRFMYYNLPGFSTFRVPKMILFLLPFAVAVVSGFGVEWLFFDEDEKKAKKIKNVIYGVAAILATTAVLTIYAYLNRDGFIQSYKKELSVAFRWAQPPDIAYKRFMNIIWGSISFITMLGGVIIFLWLCIKARLSKTWLMIFAVLFFIIDVWNVNGRFITTVRPPKIEKNEVIRFLEKDKGLFRVAPYGGQNPFFYSHFNIPVVSSYVAVSEKRFAEYRDRIDLEGRLIDLMNVKYVIIQRAEIGDAPLGSVVLGKYVVALKDDDSVVLANRDYLPRAYPAHQVVIEKDKEQVFNILNHPQFRPSDMVVLEEAPPDGLSSSPVPSSDSKVRILKYSNDVIDIEADMAENGLLVLSEKYYPGWKVYVDGKREKIYRADYIMRAVYLSKGRHTVKFVFDPWPYKVGLWLSSATFLFLIGSVIWRVRRGVDLPQDSLSMKK